MPKKTPHNGAPAPIAEAAATPVNQASAFDVAVIPAQAPKDSVCWRVTAVRHLSADENRGKHNVYVDVMDESGNRVQDPALQIGWTWEGRRPDEAAPPQPLDKPAGEPAGNVDLFKGQHVELWIEGDGLPSDRVENLHTDHNITEKTSDGQDGNTLFHHSFHVVFQRSRTETTSGKGTEPDSNKGTETGTEPGTGGGQPPAKVRWIGVVTAIELNLRSGPGTDFPRLVGLPEGSEVQVLEQTGEWLRVLAAGLAGFVHSGYVLWLRMGDISAEEAGALRPENPLIVPATAGFLAQRVAGIWNRYGGFLLTEANRLAVDPAVALAVLAVESKGDPFGPDGRMTIRFETHIFYHYWGKEHETTFREHFTFDPTVNWEGHLWRAGVNSPWQAFHGDQSAEWSVLELARSLNEEAALLSISMGAPQIMGFNYATIGFANALAMFQAFQGDVRNQLASLFRFMEVNQLVDAVRRGDYATFARVYNGSGREEAYAAEITRYVNTFQRLVAPAAAATLEAAPAMPAATPLPDSPVPGKPLFKVDPQLYAAWSKHIQQGFENNEVMFSRVLKAFLNPYWTTVWMYGILFGVGVAAFVVAAILAISGANVVATAIFGGLSIASFLTYFVNRPLQALEENLQFITWLGIIYNSYWTRLVYSQDSETFQVDVEETTNDAIAKIKELLEKHTERSGKRPNVS